MNDIEVGVATLICGGQWVTPSLFAQVPMTTISRIPWLRPDDILGWLEWRGYDWLVFRADGNVWRARVTGFVFEQADGKPMTIRHRFRQLFLMEKGKPAAGKVRRVAAGLGTR